MKNECFNSLKNQGYEFEHNYDHGNQYLSSTLAALMMLAFLVDQIARALLPGIRAGASTKWYQKGTVDEDGHYDEHMANNGLVDDDGSTDRPRQSTYPSR